MVVRPVTLALVAALVLMAHHAYAQDENALDYTVTGQDNAPVAAPVAAPAVDATGVVGGAVVEGAAVGVGVPATVYPIAPPTLAYNYYYPTPGMGQVPARLYLCPRPTPAHVGYTYHRKGFEL
jgi:hypothetical protein